MTTYQRKTAIVTGASQGIGAGLVEAFLKLGYNVVGNSRNVTQQYSLLATDRSRLSSKQPKVKRVGLALPCISQLAPGPVS